MSWIEKMSEKKKYLEELENKEIFIKREVIDWKRTIFNITGILLMFFCMNLFLVLSFINPLFQYNYLLLQIVVLDIIIVGIFAVNIDKEDIIKNKEIEERLYIKKIKDRRK